MVAIVEKAMAKQPDNRFPSLTAMISALEVELLAIGLGPAIPSALPGSEDAVGECPAIRASAWGDCETPWSCTGWPRRRARLRWLKVADRLRQRTHRSPWW